MPDALNSPAKKLSRRRFLQITAAAGALLAGGKLVGARIGAPVVTLRETRTLMGTVINLALVTEDPDHGQAVMAATFAEMQRLIACFDYRRPDSPVARLNQKGRLAAAPPELVELLALALYYGELTDGAFDISVKPLLDVYRRGGSGIESSLALVDYRGIEIEPDRIAFARPGMSITLDGIAKGRVVDAAATLLKRNGFDRVLVEAGGDLMGQGLRVDEQPWQVGLANPRPNGGPEVLSALPVVNQAVATSGDYMNSFTNDFSLHHILDPHSGLSPTDLASATVVAPTATEADALSTALMVLGSAGGLAMLERLPGVEALVITKEMQVRRTTSFPATT